MACLFIDSFDHSGTDATVHATKYHSALVASNPTTSFKRTGTHSLSMGGTLTRSFTSGAGVPVVASGSVGVVGFGLYATTFGTGKSNILRLEEAPTTTHVTVGLDTTTASAGHAHIVVYRGDVVSGTLLEKSTYELAINGWYYIELKATIHDSTGAYEVRVDGVAKASGSNVDTRNSGSGVFNQITIGGLASGAPNNIYMDDLYVLDGNADADIGGYNDFLGPQSIGWCVAQSGDGANADWTPSTGTDNGAMVDESTPDDDSTYNSSATVNQKDTYILTDPTLVNNIKVVQSVLRIRKTEASARTIKTVFRSNSTDYDQSESEVLTTYSYILQPRTTDPNTSLAWTEAAVDALQVGPKVFS